MGNIFAIIYTLYGILVLYSKVVVIMDIGMLEANTVILKKTVKYLDGTVKTVVEKRIKDNYKLIDDFFDELAQEYQSIQSYEQE